MASDAERRAVADGWSSIPGTRRHRLVFVGGLHRSGTTPLAGLLGEHPEVSSLRGTGVAADEGQHLQDVYPTARTYGGPGRFALDSRSHLVEHSHLVSPRTADRLMTAWMPYWDLRRPVLVEKSPPNLLMTRFLQALFSRSSFVLIVRHPIVVALGTEKWRTADSVRTSVANWFAAHNTMMGDLAALQRVHVVRYESLVRDPCRELETIRGFLGLTAPFPTTSWERHRSEKYTQRWAVLARRRWSWLRTDRAEIVREFGSRSAAYGYDLEDLGVLHPWQPLANLSEPVRRQVRLPDRLASGGSGAVVPAR
jgi:Sulfotransferase family